MVKEKRVQKTFFFSPSWRQSSLRRRRSILNTSFSKSLRWLWRKMWLSWYFYPNWQCSRCYLNIKLL